tara:strand:- start:617 stop:832 length:216 start_codon:yes stop_codon:yes gene_type:complete
MIEIGSLVKLREAFIAKDEWMVRDYENLIGMVVGKWDGDDEFRIQWMGKGVYFDGAYTNITWHYSYDLEAV